METVFWDTLGRKPSLVFGQECGSATVWMFAALLQRTLIWFLRLDNYLPYGLVFAMPLCVQGLACLFPFLRSSYPLLPVRLAESVIGRISPTILAVVVPAHFLGSIFAIVLFRTVFPFVPSEVFAPIVYDPSASWIWGLAVEVVVVFLYIVVVLVLPDILEVNKLHARLLSVPTLPLIWLFRAPDKTITFNPAAVYALWYVNRNFFGSATDALSDASNPLQFEHLIGPLLASVLAGLFCNYAFPDDSSAWTRRHAPKY